MIIDCHGHYTTSPKQLQDYRDAQIAELKILPLPARTKAALNITDDEIRESLEGAQLKFQRERGTDVTIFSPRASAMGHHIGDATTSLHWTQHCNDLIHRVCTLYPKNFVGVCQLPQTQGVGPANCIEELERCVNEFGFIGCNLNPDPSGGNWTAPPLTAKYWYPFYEKMVELDVPGNGACERDLQSQLPHDGLALSECGHDGVHAVHPGGSVQRLPDAALHHSARRRSDSLSLGPLSRASRRTPSARCSKT